MPWYDIRSNHRPMAAPMTKIVTPDSSPEERQAFFSDLKELAHFLNNNDRAKALLAQAQSGQISEEDCLAGLLAIETASG